MEKLITLVARMNTILRLILPFVLFFAWGGLDPTAVLWFIVLSHVLIFTPHLVSYFATFQSCGFWLKTEDKIPKEIGESIIQLWLIMKSPDNILFEVLLTGLTVGLFVLHQLYGWAIFWCVSGLNTYFLLSRVEQVSYKYYSTVLKKTT